MVDLRQTGRRSSHIAKLAAAAIDVVCPTVVPRGFEALIGVQARAHQHGMSKQIRELGEWPAGRASWRL
jgi:hypothetical protein